MASRLRRLSFLGLFSVASIATALACGDDEDAVVRPRLDGGGLAEGGTGGLACGVPVPTVYESAAFATNARVELELRINLGALDTKMRTAEGTGAAAVPATELRSILANGTPSLRAVATAGAQTAIDGYVDAFAAATATPGTAWTPAAADADGGVATGGKYEGGSIVDKVGTDLREASVATLLGGALYNHVLAIVASPLAEASIDRLVAAFGTDPTFPHNTIEDGGAARDVFVAALAAQRDDKASTTPGIYRRAKNHLLAAKAAAGAGTRCTADLGVQVDGFLLEWQRATFASAIHFLNGAARRAVAIDGPGAIDAFGTAVGLIQSFKGVSPERRVISDAQIDAVLAKIGAASPYRVVLSPGERATKIDEAILDIAAIYGMNAADVESFKKSF